MPKLMCRRVDLLLQRLRRVDIHKMLLFSADRHLHMEAVVFLVLQGIVDHDALFAAEHVKNVLAQNGVDEGILVFCRSLFLLNKLPNSPYAFLRQLLYIIVIVHALPPPKKW